MYERLKGGNENRLHNKLSVGVGGHVECLSNPECYWDHVMHTSYVEVEEEVNIPKDVGKYRILHLDEYIYSDETPVDRVHIGLIGVVNLPECEITVKEKDKIAGSLVSFDEVKKIDPERFENWTKITLKKLGYIE